MTRYDTFRARWADRTARRTTHRALRALDERQLEDIGLNRADVETRFG